MNTFLIIILIIFVLSLFLNCSVWLVTGIEDEDWVEIWIGIVGLIVLISIIILHIIFK